MKEGQNIMATNEENLRVDVTRGGILVPEPEDVIAIFETDKDGGKGGLIMVTQNESFWRDGGNKWIGGVCIRERRKGLVFDNFIYLLDGIYEWRLYIGEDIRKEREEKRKKALEKLTKEERELLGLEKG